MQNVRGHRYGRLRYLPKKFPFLRPNENDSLLLIFWCSIIQPWNRHPLIFMILNGYLRSSLKSLVFYNFSIKLCLNVFEIVCIYGVKFGKYFKTTGKLIRQCNSTHFEERHNFLMKTTHVLIIITTFTKIW